MIEIERKFLLYDVPDWEYDEIMTIEQYYIFTGEKELRVRRNHLPDGIFSYRLSMKKDLPVESGEIFARQEEEEWISEELFNMMIKFAEGYVKKHVCKKGEICISDIRDSMDHCICIMYEIEFITQKDAANFDKSEVPNLFQEVTHDPEFRVQKLATRMRYSHS